MLTKPKPNYTEDELLVLVENYSELSNYFRHKQYIQVRLMDVEQTLRKLRPAEKQAVFLLGFAELTSRAAGRLMGVDPATMWRRYRKGMVQLLDRLNGVQ